jgi:hypothetical protein
MQIFGRIMRRATRRTAACLLCSVLGPAIPAVAAPPLDHRAFDVEADPEAFFFQLVERYQSLASYGDNVRVTQTIARDGQDPRKIETNLECRIVEDGEARVRTPASQLARGVGLRTGYFSPAMKRLQNRYDLWLAPHMAMFSTTPLERLGEGFGDDVEGLAATEVNEVTIDDKPMHQLTLSTEPVEGEVTTSFDLFVNADSMLIERIEGARPLPDGSSLQTTLDITPDFAQVRDQVRTPAQNEVRDGGRDELRPQDDAEFATRRSPAGTPVPIEAPASSPPLPPPGAGPCGGSTPPGG